MNQASDSLTFPVHLPFSAHQIAEQHQRLQLNVQRGKQAYLNTLAIYAVDYYLRCLGWSTDWEASDSFNPAVIPFLDVADLVVPGIGRLECRPVLPEAEVLELPVETWDDRIGYVAVQLSSTLKQARILGFVPTASAIVPLHQLRSLEQFILYLGQLTQPYINLQQWLAGIVDQGWLSLNELLTPNQLELAFRVREQIEVTRGKPIDLGLQMGEHSLALALTVTAKDETAVDVRVQVYPIGQTCLPVGVHLTVSDEVGVNLESCSREADNLIQREFDATTGEIFSVTVAFAEATVTQTFTV